MKNKEVYIEELAKTLYLNYDMPIAFARDVAIFLSEEGYTRRPIGTWLTDRFGMERSVCSICGAVFEGDGGNYCRKCGAKMEDK